VSVLQAIRRFIITLLLRRKMTGKNIREDFGRVQTVSYSRINREALIQWPVLASNWPEITEMNLAFRKCQFVSKARAFDAALCMAGGSPINYDRLEAFGQLPMNDNRWQQRLPCP
jgi:hypothetical protein